jgi:hypothetical protein
MSFVVRQSGRHRGATNSGRRRRFRIVGGIAAAILGVVGSGVTVASGSAAAAAPATAVADAYFHEMDSSLDLAAPGVLKNDTTDPDTTYTLTVTDSSGLPTGSTVNLRSDGSFVFTPPTDWHGPASFDYCLVPAGGTECESTATVTIYVGTVLRDPPTVTAVEDTPVTGNVLTAQDNPEGFDASLVTAPVNGTLVLNADGSFTYTPNADFVGDDSFVFCMVGDNGCLTDEVAIQSITVTPGAVETSVLLTGPDSVFYGQPIPLVATVSPEVDGGTISFENGAQELPGCFGLPVTESGASCSPLLDVGEYQFNAVYVGTDEFESSGSNELTVEVLKAPTALEYTGATTYVAGSPVAVSATLTSAAAGATGPIAGQELTFLEPGGTSCTGTTDADGSAGCSLNPEQSSAIELTVVFAGSTHYQPQQVLTTIPVGTTPTTTTTLTGPATTMYGQPIELHATVSPTVDGGTIAFSDGTAVVPGCAAVVVADSAADCTVAGPLDVDQYSFTAAYSGSGDAEPSTSAPLPIEVLKAPTSLEYGGAADGTVGVPMQLSARLTNAATGTGGPLADRGIVFALSRTGICSGGGNTDATGIATCTIIPATAGVTRADAQFNGDENYLSSSAGQAGTITAATSSVHYTGPTVGTVGAPLTVTATVTNTEPGSVDTMAGHTIQFRLGDTVDHACDGETDETGTASCLITPPATGSLDLTVSFTDTSYVASTDQATVQVGLRPVDVVVAPAVGVAGGSAPLSATVTDRLTGDPVSGLTANFRAGDQQCTGVGDADGTASCSVTTEHGGTFPVTVAVTADAEHMAGAGTGELVVNPIPTALSYTGATTGTSGSPLAVSATLAAAGAPGAPGVTGPQRPAAGLRGNRALVPVVAAAGNPIAGQTIHFRLGSMQCDGVTGADGAAGCALTPASADPAARLVVTFAGTTDLAAAQLDVALAVAAAPTPTTPTPTTPTPTATAPTTTATTPTTAPTSSTTAPTSSSAAPTSSTTRWIPSTGHPPAAHPPAAHDGLAATGYDTGRWLTIALLLLGAGSLLIFLGRRRGTSRRHHRVG